MNPTEVGDTLSEEERSRLRDEQQELEKLPYEEQREALLHFYSEFIQEKVESPENTSKKIKFVC